MWRGRRDQERSRSAVSDDVVGLIWATVRRMPSAEKTIPKAYCSPIPSSSSVADLSTGRERAVRLQRNVDRGAYHSASAVHAVQVSGRSAHKLAVLLCLVVGWFA